MNNVMDNNFSNYNFAQISGNLDHNSVSNNFSSPNIYLQSNSHLSRRGNAIMSAGPQSRYLQEHNTNPLNFNQNMNELVRSNLKSRGINLVDYQNMNSNQQAFHDYNRAQGENYSFGYSSTNNESNERKRMLLNNIQQQMLLNRNTKINELERKRREDEKYLRDIESSYPFGKGGAGAPMRDKLGNIITNRRALISDPKYFHISTKIDDDFHEVNRNGGNISNRGENFMPHGIQQNHVYQNYNHIPNINARAQSGRNSNSNFNKISNDIYPNQQSPNESSYQNNNNNNQGYNGIINGHNYSNSNFPVNYPQNENQLNNYANYETNTYQNQLNNTIDQNNTLNYEMTNPNYYEYKTSNHMNLVDNINSKIQHEFNNLPKDESNLMPNGATDDNPKKKERQDYGSYLRSQMEISKKKKEMEKEQEKRKEIEEEIRIKKELEIIKQQEEMEKDKKKQEMDKIFNENQALRDQYVVNKKKVKFSSDHLPSNISYNNHQHNSMQDYNLNTNTNANFNNNTFNEKKQNEEFLQGGNNYNSAIEENLELNHTINNELLNIKNNFVEQQNILLKQLNDLKTETQNSNLQRYEVLKEFSSLKDEMSKLRVDEEMRRKYVYDVLVDNNTKATNIYTNTKLPDLRPEDYKVVLPKPKNHSKNIKEIYYDDTIKYPNRVQEIPNLDDLQEKKIKSESKFIDVDTHNIYDNLNIYQPEQYTNKNEKENARGLKLDDDFGPLRSYYKEKENINDYFHKQNREYGKISFSDQEIYPYLNNKINVDNKLDKEPNRDDKNNFKSYVEDDLEYNKEILEKETLSINQIYNKNLERLRYLNKLEENINYENRNMNNYDDFLTKLEKYDTKSGNINFNINE
jgi:hypothetical protein